MANNLKVIFKRVHLTKGGSRGHGTWYFTATVDGTALAPSALLFVTDHHSSIDLPVNEWSRVVDVAAKNQFTIDFKVKDNFDNSDLGSVTVQIKAPWSQYEVRRKTRNFVLEYSIELEVAGAFGLHPPGTVFATRASPGTSGAMDFSTVSGSSFLARLEAHEVRPTPPMANGPDRPNFPVTAPPAHLNQGAIALIEPRSPINVIPNPPVIPIIPAAAVTAHNAARIEVTYYRPRTLAFSEHDSRLEWSSVALAGGAVAFFGATRGTHVKVYGTAQGEVELQAKFRGTVVVRYRALVLPLKTIRCRANILEGPTRAAKPKVDPKDIVGHVKVANRFLRPLGVELKFDATIVGGWLPNKNAAAVSSSPTATMQLVVGPNKHRFNVAPNTLNGAVATINGLNAGVTASIESNAAGTQHRLQLRYDGNPSMRLIDAPAGAATDITGATYANTGVAPVSAAGKLRLRIGVCDHDFSLSAKNNNLAGLNHAVNAIIGDVIATITDSGAPPNPYRLVMQPLPAKHIELIDDPDGAKTSVASAVVTNGAVETSTSGIFRIPVLDGDTRNVSGSFPNGTAFNWRPRVFNFAYIVSGSPGVLGSAIDRQNNAGANISDNRTPSSSWKSPSGIPPHGAAGNVTMALRPPRRRNGDPPPAPNPFDGLYSMWVATKEANPKTLFMKYGNTIAHELGHVLHLGHRSNPAGAVDDGVLHPPNENIMHPTNTEAIAQDFDILQARAVRLSPLLT